MNYVFTGNSEFLITEALNKWKKQFIEKYSDFNLTHLKEIKNLDKNILKDTILSGSLFSSEKKLIILDINNDIGDELEDFLIKNLEKKPQENIIILNYFLPDKRKKFWKNIKNISEIKEFNLENEEDTKKIINSKFSGKIDLEAINTIIKYKSNKINKIIPELEKLTITKNFITKIDIEANIVPELEESIFQIIDLVLNKQIPEAVDKINIILNETNIFAFYNNLLSNLRTSLFILELKQEKKTQSEISKILDLGNRSFLIGKNYKINFHELKNLYINLVNIDKNLKTGKLVSSEEEDIKFEIEKYLIKI
ncbi:hypothetical protein D8B46_08075 [Candidatus Gracilibacteria bacterium]|nr:MAG: hypothetical protein D8B46_08075 [Candidatus Gracilibacteria bacterium]